MCSQAAQRGGEAADPGERGEHPPAGGRDPPWIPTALPGGAAAAAAVSPRGGIGAVQRVGRLQDGAVGRKGRRGQSPGTPPAASGPGGDGLLPWIAAVRREHGKTLGCRRDFSVFGFRTACLERNEP